MGYAWRMPSATGVFGTPFQVVNNTVFMSSAMIQDASITNAKIGADIQSNSYVTGQSGWRINKGGLCEFTSVQLNGGTLTAGLVKSSDGKMQIDLANKSITITT